MKKYSLTYSIAGRMVFPNTRERYRATFPQFYKQRRPSVIE
jgi:hypothetical protein